MKFLQIIPLFAAAANAALQFKGADWSSLLVEEAGGKTYKNTGGTIQPLETILRNSGVNTVRQRLWVKPSDGTYNLAYIKLAKRAQAAGLKVYLDLHFSDTWADPSHQTLPSGWPSDIDNLAWKTYNHTLEVSNAFQVAGIPLAIISIGNEITTGLLWPLGKTNNFYNIARLLHSASAGIKASNLSTKPKILIHLDNGWNWETQKWWYTSVLGQGPLVSGDYDMMGVSYYPFYNNQATLGNLKTSLKNMASTWGKQLVVAETNWPVSCPSPAYGFPSDTISIPKNVGGQITWIKDVASAVAGASGGVGLFYWEPAWIRNAHLGSSCADNLMVDGNGKARSSMGVFGSI